MRIAEQPIELIGDLITKLKNDTKSFNGPIWFRGQSNSSWRLIPRLMRMSPPPSESFYINKFKQDASILITNKPKSEFDWLFLMQHYGIPTRLLDWSESPLVALYFALSENLDKDGALWMLLPTELNKKSNYKPEYEFEIPSFEDEHMQNYLPSTIASERKSRLFPMAAIAPRNSTRMQAQKGVFTINHRDIISIDEAGEDGGHKDQVWKYIIPQDKKDILSMELKILGINKFQLFPELESISENLK